MNNPAIKRIRDLISNHGFLVVLAIIFGFFSISTTNFLSIANLFGILHTMAPLTVMSLGLALVVISGKIDISVGSIAFLSGAVAIIAMRTYALSGGSALLIAVAVGALCGCFNGFLVAVMRVDPLITTLGTMITYRGAALQLTNSVMLQIPSSANLSGNVAFGPLFADTLFAAAVVVLFYTLHVRTPFGRTITAIGNDQSAAQKIGLPVSTTVFSTFVISGVTAALAGAMTVLQLGAVTAFLGQGAEFSALAVIVVGGISLTGGRGNLLVGLPLGAFMFEIIRNGLIQVGADPYSYRLVGGVVIFVAMYADAIRTKLIAGRRKQIEDGTGQELSGTALS